jgi:hypothetical protein
MNLFRVKLLCWKCEQKNYIIYLEPTYIKFNFNIWWLDFNEYKTNYDDQVYFFIELW